MPDSTPVPPQGLLQKPLLEKLKSRKPTNIETKVHGTKQKEFSVKIKPSSTFEAFYEAYFTNTGITDKGGSGLRPDLSTKAATGFI